MENVENYVWAAICLHNYLRLTDNATYTPYGFVDNKDSTGNIKEGDWRKMCPEESTCFRKIKKIRGSRQNEGSEDMRNALKDYVNSVLIINKYYVNNKYDYVNNKSLL